jgi:hypothetical protein
MAFVDWCFLEGSTTAGLMYTVSLVSNPLRFCRADASHFLRLQTVAHSVLSTRIVLHTGQALRQGPVYPRPSFIRDSLPRKMVLVSEVAIGQRGMNGSGHRMMASDVELQQLINNDT